MKKKIISMEQPFHDVFYAGLRLGFELGTLGHRIAPKVFGRTEKEILTILRREVGDVFKSVQVKKKR